MHRLPLRSSRRLNPSAPARQSWRSKTSEGSQLSSDRHDSLLVRGSPRWLRDLSGTSETGRADEVSHRVATKRLEQGFGDCRVNIGMNVDLSTLAGTLLTISSPSSSQGTSRFGRSWPRIWRSTCAFAALVTPCIANYSAHVAIATPFGWDCSIRIIASFLTIWRATRWWLAHPPVFGDTDAIPLVASITDGQVGRGNPVSFDPHAFIERRLRRFEYFHRLTGRHDWLEDDFP